MSLQAFVVEDSPGIRESLIETLAELAGIETAGFAGSERAAVAWLTDPAHVWDVAIVDLILEPGGSGFGVLRALQQRRPDQKMVVLTGAATVQTREQCQALGGDRVFDKSMETEALLDYCITLAQQQSGAVPAQTLRLADPPESGVAR